MPVLTTDEYQNLKRWVCDEMQSDKLIALTKKQIDGFKMLIIEEYGWPEFTLNFSKDMKHIIKIEL
jgi:hypothetical protein